MTVTATNAPSVEFIPHPLLRDGHAMTIAPAFWPRKMPREFSRNCSPRLFQVDQNVRVLAHCHWQRNPKQHPTLIVLHGLEGCADSNHVKGTASKAYYAGMNVIRLNLRNCGGSMHLTPTLYNAGLSADLICILQELAEEGLSNVMVVGYSLGGNIVLKAAGELGSEGRNLLSAIAAISPSLDLEYCVQAIALPQNRVYERFFLRTLKQKIREKAKKYPELYDLTKIALIKTIRDFDDMFTAPHGGYGTAENYYREASAKKVLQRISIPTLIIASEDDPLVPFDSFSNPGMSNPQIRLYATTYGGHAGFIQHKKENDEHFDRFWAENRVITFCQEVRSQLTA